MNKTVAYSNSLCGDDVPLDAFRQAHIWLYDHGEAAVEVRSTFPGEKTGVERFPCHNRGQLMIGILRCVKLFATAQTEAAMKLVLTHTAGNIAAYV